MLEISGADDDFKVSGFVSLPELTRASRQYITITINHRYIRNFELTKAIIQGYESKLMVGRYPIAVINIDLDPVLVDVNVHPAKREVRLSKEQQLMKLIAETIRKRIPPSFMLHQLLSKIRMSMLTNLFLMMMR